MISGRLRKKLSGSHNHCYISSHCFFVAKRIHKTQPSGPPQGSASTHTRNVVGGGGVGAF